MSLTTFGEQYSTVPWVPLLVPEGPAHWTCDRPGTRYGTFGTSPVFRCSNMQPRTDTMERTVLRMTVDDHQISISSRSSDIGKISDRSIVREGPNVRRSFQRHTETPSKPLPYRSTPLPRVPISKTCGVPQSPGLKIISR